MRDNMGIKDLIDSAKQHMENEGNAAKTVYKNHWIWRKLLEFATERKIETFDTGLVNQFLSERFGINVGNDVSENAKISDQYAKSVVCSLGLLVDYSLHGYFSKHTRGEKCLWPDGFADSCREFIDYFSSLGYSDRVVRKHELNLNRFIRFASSHNANNLGEITVENIYDYFRMMSHLSRSALSDIRRTLVRAFRFFHEKGLCPNDLSEHVPKIVYCARAKFSKIWSEEELRKILDSIDRANPYGKRDYAIIAIAANLGLRAVDIVSLTINAFDWKQNTLTIIQKKTGEPLTLPISEAMGKAVIDYWKNARPQTSAEELFVKLVYPYDRLADGSLYEIFNKRLPAAGIPLPSRKHGLHSLRHSLASRLLEVGTSVKAITDILGQVSPDTAKQYIRIDVKQLRECTLEVPDHEFN